MIQKKLKNIKYSWDENEKMLLIHHNNSKQYYGISKIEMFSLARFIIRISQRGGKRKRK